MTALPADRVAFFVDGFNLYHSVCRAAQALPGSPVKWLDLRSLFLDHLHLDKHQFTGQIRLPSGKHVTKPAEW